MVLDPRVQGRITVISEQELDREGVRRLFYSVLDAQGFSIIDQGDRLLIIPAAEAKAQAGYADISCTTSRSSASFIANFQYCPAAKAAD